MPNKILVIRLSSLGDVVLTAPVFRSLKIAWPDCSISVLVKPQFAGALRGHPLLHEVIPFRGLRSAVASVRAGGFTHLLDLHATPRSFVIRSLSGVPAVSVYKKDALARRLFVSFGLRSPALEKHTIERYLEALASWGVPAADPGLEFGDYGEADPALPQEPSTPRPGRVLVIQTAFLGDCLLTLPLLRELKALCPASRVAVLTTERTEEVFAGSPWVDETIVDRKRGEHAGFFGALSMAALLRERRFDCAVIPHRSLRSAFLAWLAGIRERIGFSTSAGSFLLTRRVPFAWHMHDLERNLGLLLPFQADLKLRPDESRYLDPQAGDAAAKRLASAGIGPGDRVAAVHPGSTWPTKKWFESRFRDLCRGLIADGVKVVIVGGAADRGLCARLAADSGAADLSGGPLSELKSLMARLSLFVTNDSGPMHVAAASGVPTLAIFGPTTRELGFFPYGPGHRVLEVDLDCRPCALHGGRSCPRGHFLCMGLITVDMALQASREMLAAQERPSLKG
ncbi:MAG: glycosyltransferase family 9 protein [Elusimicrobiota bacterium]|jgi:heptosyltransferase-2